MLKKISNSYKDLYTKITGDPNTEVLELCFANQLQTVPIKIYGDPASVPAEIKMLPAEIIDICAARAVYSACIIHKNMKYNGDNVLGGTDQYLSSFSAGGVSMTFSSADPAAVEKADAENLEELKLILWEIPQELYRKYRTNKNCYWRV